MGTHASVDPVTGTGAVAVNMLDEQKMEASAVAVTAPCVRGWNIMQLLKEPGHLCDVSHRGNLLESNWKFERRVNCNNFNDLFYLT